MVPFNDLRRRFLSSRGELLGAWAEFLDDGIFIGGASVAGFEQAFAHYCGTEFCIGVANGTDALELSLRGLEVGSGDEVITVANAGGYATTACHAVGATPVYIDVSEENCQVAFDAIEGAVTPSTRAIIVTHLYGMMNDVQRVRAILTGVGRADIGIIEDCAQAHGASQHDSRAGSLGDVGAFSFYPTKNLGGVGDAGAIVCRNRELAERIRQLRQYGWKAKYQTTLAGGRNSRMDPIQAVVLSAELQKLPDTNRQRKAICDLYRQNLPQGWTMVYSANPNFVGHLAVLVADRLERRRDFIDLLKARAIGCDIHYPILDCDQPGWIGMGRTADGLPVSRSLTQRVVSLPCFPELTQGELDQVVDALHAFR